MLRGSSSWATEVMGPQVSAQSRAWFVLLKDGICVVLIPSVVWKMIWSGFWGDMAKAVPLPAPPPFLPFFFSLEPCSTPHSPAVNRRCSHLGPLPTEEAKLKVPAHFSPPSLPTGCL